MYYKTDANGNIKFNVAKYRNIGIYIKNDGTLEGMNENIFARHLCRTFDIAVLDDTRLYQYKDNYWQPLSDMEISRILRDYFNQLIPDGWSSGIANLYKSAYFLEMPRTDNLTPADDYININNGLYYFGDKWALIPHSKRIFTTTRIPINYYDGVDPGCPTFESFIYDISCKDDELVMLLQEIMGYCLSNSTDAHKFAIFYGKGRNGKSVYMKVLTALIGKMNISNIQLKNFGNSFELASIVDKRVNISSENEFEGKHMRTDLFKSISAGDEIQINAKHQQPFTYKPFAKLIFAVNKMPRTLDVSEGYMDRLLLVPFDMKYVDEPKNNKQGKRDPQLTKKLLKELDGIFV
jgi:putative DNA primase/helicase